MNTSSMLEENDGHEISNERSREDEQNQILTPLTSQEAIIAQIGGELMQVNQRI